MQTTRGNQRPVKSQTTTFCRAFGRPEFVIHYDEPPVLSSWAQWLLSFLESQIMAGIAYQPGETLQVGWMMTKVMQAGPHLAICEPDFVSMPVKWVQSVSQTLLDLHRQKYVAESVGLEQQLNFPNFQLTAIVCSNVLNSHSFLLARGTPSESNERDSGWFLGCTDGTHNHNTLDTLSLASLYECAVRNPAIVPYLALPIGTHIISDPPRFFEVGLAGVELPVLAGSYLEKMLKV